MSEHKNEYIKYRLEKCKRAFADAKVLMELGSFDSAINRLYYSCYYAVSALAITNGLDSKTHTGLINQLNLYYIKTGIIPPEHGKFYSKLFEYRQKSDYNDFFDVDNEVMEKLLPQAKEFIDIIESLIIS